MFVNVNIHSFGELLSKCVYNFVNILYASDNVIRDIYLPPAMIETTFVPIVKNKSGNSSDSSNYRPIALATIISKMFESVLLLKCAEYLSTSDNQFGFKSCHSTVLIYVFTH